MTKKVFKSIKRISVIVPVYNVEPYLQRCVESLINQDYPCIEIILIDDGSTDDSGHIADALAHEHSNVIVLHQENKGVSNARNMGLRRSSGDYIGFVDPDDFVDREMYAYLYEQIQINSADIAACTWINEYEDNTRLIEKAGTDAIFTAEEAVAHDLLMGMSITCNKLFSRKVCHNVYYDEKIINGEDRLFDLQALLNAAKVVYVNKPFYHYCHRSNSAGAKKYTPMDASLISVCDKIYCMVAWRSENLKKIAELQKINAYMQLIMMMDGEIDKYSPDGRIFLQALRKCLIETLKNPKANAKDKFRAIFMSISPFLYNKVMKIWKIIRFKLK